MLHNRIREYRRKMGWTQSELASIIGVDRAYISRLEMNKQQPGRKTMIKLTQVFNCSLNDLFYMDDQDSRGEKGGQETEELALKERSEDLHRFQG